MNACLFLISAILAWGDVEQTTGDPSLIQEIIYKNANHVSKRELAEITGLKPGIPLDPLSNKRAAYAIQDYLQKQGRYFANVVLEEGGDPADKRVVFKITEGPVVRVTKIQFVGKHDPAISDFFQLGIGSSTCGRFNPAEIDNQVLKLEEYYKANGYMDVQITRELLFDEDLRGVTVVFHICEGQRYRIENVVVEGNSADFTRWRANKAMVKRELYFPEPGISRVVYEVEEKPLAKVGQIIIQGNDRTKDEVIRKAIVLYPGQTFNYADVKLAERNLEKLGIFEVNKEKGIRPTVTVLESDNEFKDIQVQVQETPTGSLMLGAGFNAKGQLVVSMTLQERNFDPHRWPTSLADIQEGRAFRGGGKKLRLDVFRVTAPGSLDVLRWYLK
jgi:outer membrane protein insertion porin family